MEISFQSKELRDLCTTDAVAAARLGEAVAEALKRRLSDLRAADGIHEVVAGRPQIVMANGQQRYRFELAEGWSINVTAAHTVPRNHANGQTDWLRVRRIRVVSVEA